MAVISSCLQQADCGLHPQLCTPQQLLAECHDSMLHSSRLLSTQRLPAQVFDDKGQFGEWFGETIGKEGPGGKDSWLETEKRVVVINRLHQILEPFMLRRQVQDVEGKLPPKVRALGRAPS